MAYHLPDSAAIVFQKNMTILSDSVWGAGGTPVVECMYRREGQYQWVREDDKAYIVMPREHSKMGIALQEASTRGVVICDLQKIKFANATVLDVHRKRWCEEIGKMFNSFGLPELGEDNLSVIYDIIDPKSTLCKEEERGWTTRMYTLNTHPDAKYVQDVYTTLHFRDFYIDLRLPLTVTGLAEMPELPPRLTWDTTPNVPPDAQKLLLTVLRPPSRARAAPPRVATHQARGAGRRERAYRGRRLQRVGVDDPRAQVAGRPRPPVSVRALPRLRRSLHLQHRRRGARGPEHRAQVLEVGAQRPRRI